MGAEGERTVETVTAIGGHSLIIRIEGTGILSFCSVGACRLSGKVSASNTLHFAFLPDRETNFYTFSIISFFLARSGIFAHIGFDTGIPISSHEHGVMWCFLYSYYFGL